MANLLDRIITRVGGSTINKIVDQRVKEEVSKANSVDIMRFSPTSYGLKNLNNEKPFPLGVTARTLREFADFYPIARAAIEYRKTQITHLDWTVTPIEITDKTVQDKQNIENSKKLKELFKYPTGKKDSSFTNWLKQILEDLFVIDAVAIYRKKNRRGDVIGYLPVDGATIVLELEDDGTTPSPPQTAYIQKIGGRDVAKLTTDDLIYAMMNPRTHSAYGMAPLESLIITVTTALKLQAYSLSFLCYDDQTEILTKDGWKYFRELTDDDIVATRNKEEKFEWQKLLSRHEFDYMDNLVRFKSATVDLLVTPNHRMLTDYRGSNGNYDKKSCGIIKRADWFIENNRNKTQSYLVPTKSIWKGDSPSFFTLDEVDVEIDQRFSGYAFCGRDKNNKPIRSKKKFLTDRKRRVIHLPEVKVDTSDWSAFLGIYLAEGWCRKENSESKHEIYISQKRTSKYWVEINDLLERLPFKFKYNDRTGKWACCDKQLWIYLKELGHSYNKWIPNDIKNYDRELLDVLWTWMFKGDGHLQRKTKVYSTVSKKLAGDVQEILQKIGYDPRVSVINQSVGKIIKGKRNPIKTTRPIYKIFARTDGHRSLSCASYQYYEGKVSSVKVPNGIVYVRRNGIPIWCGNTEGNVPEGFVTLPRDIASSRDQLKEWQEAWDAMLSGDPRFQRKLKFLPEGMKYQPARQSSDMTFERFEKWLLQCTTSAFGLHPSAIGFNFDVNRASAQSLWEAGRERGLFPTALFLKEIMDRMIQDDLGHPELQFTWTNIDPTNKAEEAKVVQTLVNTGLMAIDEWRLGEGLKPTGIKDPFVMTPVGPIFLKDLAAQSAAGQEPVAPYKPPTERRPSDTNRLPIPSQARISQNDYIQEIKKWRKVALNDFKDKKPIREFETDIIDKRTCGIIKTELTRAKSKEAIQQVFKPFIEKKHLTNNALLSLYDGINNIISRDGRSSQSFSSRTTLN